MKPQQIHFSFTIRATHEEFVKAYGYLSSLAAGHYLVSKQTTDSFDTTTEVLEQVIDRIGQTMSDQELEDQQERVKQAAIAFSNLFPEN